MENCVFCKKKNHFYLNGQYAVAVFDEFPVSIGHTLIIPKRHVESLFELTDEELKDIYTLIVQSKNKLDELYKPDGYNIGINEGRAAGRTIDHVHIHIIPRYIGDVENPRGGIRGVIPDKKEY